MNRLLQELESADFNSMNRVQRWKAIRQYLRAIGASLQDNEDLIESLAEQLESLREKADELAAATGKIEALAKKEAYREESGMLNVMDNDDVVIDRAKSEEPSPSETGIPSSDRALTEPPTASYTEEDLVKALEGLKGFARKSSQKAADEIIRTADDTTVANLVEALRAVQSAPAEPSAQLSLGEGDGEADV